MSEESRTEAERLLAEHNAVRAALGDDEVEASGISIVMAWVLGLACVLVGYILGNLLPLQVHS